MKKLSLVILLSLLSAAAFAQEAQPKLSQTESLQLKLSLLTTQLAESQVKIQKLEQQLTILAIRAEHGWGSDFQITVDPSGNLVVNKITPPASVPSPK